ncbi:hypothetical protein CLAFUW4_14843 [Fulvia fulva]|nr:hypothetical protein CLAFUR0_14836 [Fulvia fulva]WPV23004.1 hypothetical protein CLAFUW4_14843 [Fulvia fulva]WPV37940.1 hypothetical protein CLAFUW7_14844 [Fulvia fulva]
MHDETGSGFNSFSDDFIGGCSEEREGLADRDTAKEVAGNGDNPEEGDSFEEGQGADREEELEAEGVDADDGTSPSQCHVLEKDLNRRAVSVSVGLGQPQLQLRVEERKECEMLVQDYPFRTFCFLLRSADDIRIAQIGTPADPSANPSANPSAILSADPPLPPNTKRKVSAPVNDAIPLIDLSVDSDQDMAQHAAPRPNKKRIRPASSRGDSLENPVPVSDNND